ncbi:MAG: FecR domain-containing protein [Gemmatimonadaceae bacterium]|nr:FecR domain-containing protein [Gemmatimonadaceae bacterium]
MRRSRPGVPPAPLRPLSDDELERLLAGECPPDEEAVLRRRLEGTVGREGLAEIMRTAVLVDAKYREFERLRAREDERDGTVPPLRLITPCSAPPVVSPSVAEPRRRRRSARWAIAAGVLVAIAGGGSVAAWIAHAHVPAALGGRRARYAVRTGFGERRGVTLPDGTRLMLAPASRIAYDARYGRPVRAVTLTGEAYFDVAHDATHPFVVRTAQGTFEDLGTQFVVRAYGGDRVARVAVRTGRVAARGGGSGDGQASAEVVVEPGDVATVDARGGAARVTADTGGYFAWTSGVLAFDDAAAPEIAAALGWWYGLDVRLAPPLDAQHVTVELPSDTVTNALDYLATVLRAHYHRAGQVVTFEPR